MKNGGRNRRTTWRCLLVWKGLVRNRRDAYHDSKHTAQPARPVSLILSPCRHPPEPRLVRVNNGVPSHSVSENDPPAVGRPIDPDQMEECLLRFVGSSSKQWRPGLPRPRAQSMLHQISPGVRTGKGTHRPDPTAKGMVTFVPHPPVAHGFTFRSELTAGIGLSFNPRSAVLPTKANPV
jgi:hypothetical protein